MLHLNRILLALYLISSVSATLCVDEYRYTILGQAVDGQGQPVPDAYIVVSPGPDNRGGDFIYTGKTDAEGRIRVEVTDSNLVRTTRLLYVTGPLPLNAITPIRPPFVGFRWLSGPAYAGHRVRIKKNDEVDVGSIPIKVFYHTVKVFLRDRFDKPLLKSADAWRSVSLRIRDARGHFVAETSISPDQLERAVSQIDSGMTLALPQGVWRIEVSPDENSPWLTSEKPVHVNESGEQLEVILKER